VIFLAGALLQSGAAKTGATTSVRTTAIIVVITGILRIVSSP